MAKKNNNTANTEFNTSAFATLDGLDVETKAKELGLTHLVLDGDTNTLVCHDSKGREVQAEFKPTEIIVRKSGINAPYEQSFNDAVAAREAFLFQVSDTQN